MKTKPDMKIGWSQRCLLFYAYVRLYGEVFAFLFFCIFFNFSLFYFLYASPLSLCLSSLYFTLQKKKKKKNIYIFSNEFLAVATRPFRTISFSHDP